MKTVIRGKVFVFGDDVNTDEIIPGIKIRDAPNLEELAKYTFEPVRPHFWKEVKEGDIIIAGKNFGCGSSREMAPLVIKETGIRAILAESFARIFYRNAVNIGLPPLETKDIGQFAQEGDELEIDLDEFTVSNITKNKSIQLKPLPMFLIEMLQEGGLVSFLKVRDGYSIV
jgi:3-isopropylmalate/(R)-2-methylmalate dehydratase small subunit